MMKLLCCIAAVGLCCASVGPAAADDTTLRRTCAHLIKMKYGIKETGSANDLRGIRGAIAEVDRCVANKGKVS